MAELVADTRNRCLRNSRSLHYARVRSLRSGWPRFS